MSDFRLRGFYLEDETFDPVTVAIRDTQSGRTAHLKVIGVLADSVPYAMIGISTSAADPGRVRSGGCDADRLVPTRA